MKEAGAAKTVVPELMPRALFWFRWGAAWTWITGVILLMLVFYHGGIMFDYDSGASWGPASFAALALTFLGVFVYDALYKSPLAENPKVAHTVAFLLVAAVLLLMAYPAHMTFRAYTAEGGQRLEVEVNGQTVAWIGLGAGWMEYEITVPASVARQGLNEIWLRFETLYPASEIRLAGTEHLPERRIDELDASLLVD